MHKKYFTHFFQSKKFNFLLKNPVNVTTYNLFTFLTISITKIQENNISER